MEENKDSQALLSISNINKIKKKLTKSKSQSLLLKIKEFESNLYISNYQNYNNNKKETSKILLSNTIEAKQNVNNSHNHCFAFDTNSKSNLNKYEECKKKEKNKIIFFKGRFNPYIQNINVTKNTFPLWLKNNSKIIFNFPKEKENIDNENKKINDINNSFIEERKTELKNNFYIKENSLFVLENIKASKKSLPKIKNTLNLNNYKRVIHSYSCSSITEDKKEKTELTNAKDNSEKNEGMCLIKDIYKNSFSVSHQSQIDFLDIDIKKIILKKKKNY